MIDPHKNFYIQKTFSWEGNYPVLTMFNEHMQSHDLYHCLGSSRRTALSPFSFAPVCSLKGFW